MIANTKRSQLVASLKFLDSRQNVVEDTHGNISCRDGWVVPLDIVGAQQRQTFTIKPSGVAYDEIGGYDLVTLYIDDNSVFLSPSSMKPSVDASEHAEVYRRNPQVQSICHTHSPYATAIAIQGASMAVMCTEHADYFGHVIRCLPFASYDEWGKIDLAVPEQVVLLGNHGVLVTSHDPDPLKAAKLAVAVEAIAKKYVIAASIGLMDSDRLLDQDEVDRWNKRYNTVYGQ